MEFAVFLWLNRDLRMRNKCLCCILVARLVFQNDAVVQEVIYRNTIGEQNVETGSLFIRLSPVDHDVRFFVTLKNGETGLKRRHVFEGEGANDPVTYQICFNELLHTHVILLTVEYPWRHALPQFGRILDTFAFRESGFKFIDVAFGPVTDIALADDMAYDPSDLDMLPPIRVRCLEGQDEKPFEFFEQEINLRSPEPMEGWTAVLCAPPPTPVSAPGFRSPSKILPVFGGLEVSSLNADA
jgi:hypothetical protein